MTGPDSRRSDVVVRGRKAFKGAGKWDDVR